MPTREQIRTFHLTGQGLEDLVPANALHPALLDGLTIAPVRSETLPELHAASLAAMRGPARERFLTGVKSCRDRINELLALDDSRSPEAYSSHAIVASLGDGTASFFDGAALATALHRQLSPVTRMEPDRRARCQATLATLEEALHEAADQPLHWLFPTADDAALPFCRQKLDRLSAVLRAIRVARLEAQAEYDPALHDEWLKRFTWESADEDELAAMPPIVILETAERVAETSRTSFGRLLRSGLPFQILVTCPGLYSGDLGFQAIAHREAFVLQSSLANPVHLRAGLDHMTSTLRPAVAVVSILENALFYKSRALPLFEYDPDRGEHWWDRFVLFSDASPIPALNAVHVAAVFPEMRSQFRILPDSAWDDEQLELTEYLGKYTKQPPLAIPYIWVDGKQRAILTRELANLARDRIMAWKMLGELAGAGPKKAEPVDETQQQRARQEGASQAIHRVVAILTAKAV